MDLSIKNEIVFNPDDTTSEDQQPLEPFLLPKIILCTPSVEDNNGQVMDFSSLCGGEVKMESDTEDSKLFLNVSDKEDNTDENRNAHSLAESLRNGCEEDKSVDQNDQQVLNLSQKAIIEASCDEKNFIVDPIDSEHCTDELKSNADDIESQCKICKREFTSKRLMAKHQAEHKTLDGLQLVANLRSYLAKALARSEGSTFLCSKCPWAFSSVEALQQHTERTHPKTTAPENANFMTNVKQEQVKISRLYPSRVPTRKHERVRISRLYPSRVVLKKYQCNICKISFNNRNERRAHSAIHSKNEDTGAEMSTEMCCFCGKALPEATHLQIYMNNNTSENVYACEECEPQITQSEESMKNKKASTDEKPYLCEVCGHRFHTLSNLERHNKVHTGEKPFSCTLCEKSYAYMHALKQHYRMHTQEKPYNCEVCGKAFARRDYLKEHLRVHTKEKPYICKICGRGFSQGGSLKLHQKVHTGRLEES